MKWSYRKFKTAFYLALGIGSSSFAPAPIDGDVRVMQRAEISGDADETLRRSHLRDTRLKTEIASALSHSCAGPYDWGTVASVRSGIVTLTGRVRHEAQRDEYERIAAAAPGVRHVFNNIRALLRSTYDDQLRASILRAFYQQPRLRPYCTGPACQIHILVEYGDVTLEGRVRSNADKRFAENLAISQVRAFGVVNNLIVEPGIARRVSDTVIHALESRPSSP
jgi:osmotically-inducible protein OsmY